jgi:hypothetical protein
MLASVKAAKQSNLSLALACILSSSQRHDAPTSPTPDADDDDRVKLISMLGLNSSSSSSSSPGDSSVPDTVNAPHLDHDATTSIIVIPEPVHFKPFWRCQSLDATELETQHPAFTSAGKFLTCAHFVFQAFS